MAETPELQLTVNDDESVTVRWARSAVELRDDFVAEQRSEQSLGEAAPF